MTTRQELLQGSGPTAQPPIEAGSEVRLSYSIPALCKATSLSRTTVYEAIKDGRLRIAKVGSRTIVLSDDAHSFLRGARDGE